MVLLSQDLCKPQKSGRPLRAELCGEGLSQTVRGIQTALHAALNKAVEENGFSVIPQMGVIGATGDICCIPNWVISYATHVRAGLRGLLGARQNEI